MWVLDHRNNVERTSSSTKDGHCESPGKAREAPVRWSVWPVHPQKPRSLHLLTQCSAMERHAEQQSEEKEDVPRDSPNTRWTPNITWKYRHVTFVDLMKRHLFERIKLFEITKLMLLWLCYNLLKCNQITYPFTITDSIGLIGWKNNMYMYIIHCGSRICKSSFLKVCTTWYILVFATEY